MRSTSSPTSPDGDAARARERSALRARWRAWRRSLSPETRLRAAQALAAHARTQSWLTNARIVGAYVADDGEIDPAPLVEMLRSAGAMICYPRAARGDRTLEFAPLGEVPTMPDRWEIPAPAREIAVVDLVKIEIVLVPGVVFDARGGRIGRGAGLYDRTFATMRELAPLLVGIAHESQVVAEISMERHDGRMDWLITDRGVRRCRARGAA